MLQRSQLNFLFLNVGHFLDHYFMLIFATAAALRLITEWNLTYAELIPYATPGFIAFGICAIPAGWLADKWSRQGMLLIFFIGIGISSVLAGLANSPLGLGKTKWVRRVVQGLSSGWHASDLAWRDGTSNRYLIRAFRLRNVSSA